MIAAASQVTETIHLGPMVKLLPMHHPVRLIEDMCTLDQLTEGRLEYGVGRGAVPAEHNWFSGDYGTSRERFVDALGIIDRALRTGEISSEESRFYDFVPMPLSTKPFQERIPFWYPGNPRTAGRHGMSLMWPGAIGDDAHDAYLQAWEDHRDDDLRLDGPDSRPRVGYSMLLAIAPTESEALDIARRGMDGLIRRTRNAHRFDPLVMPDEGDRDDAQSALRAIIAGMDDAIRFGAGTPSPMAERLSALIEDPKADHIAFMFPAGDMTVDESKRTLDLFATEVMPQLVGQTSTSS
jgi:alkanesulfonate monooxygenase SsuD/methylene tetrahydromethanopterin reductase-like flavin-dependent oxidoreductase (luciferase family)